MIKTDDKEEEEKEEELGGTRRWGLQIPEARNTGSPVAFRQYPIAKFNPLH